MPFKVFLPEANCWLWEVTQGQIEGYGWPAELNGSEIAIDK